MIDAARNRRGRPAQIGERIRVRGRGTQQQGAKKQGERTHGSAFLDAVIGYGARAWPGAGRSLCGAIRGRERRA